MVTWDKFVALGDRQSLNNPFGWYTLVVNLTVTTSYYSQISWFYNKKRDGLVVSNFLSVWVIGDLLDQQKHFVAKRVDGWG